MIRSTPRRPRLVWHALALLALLSSFALSSNARAATFLSVTITDTRATASPGDTLSFFVTVANTNTVAIPNATVTVTLPADVAYLASSGGTPAGQVVTWTSQNLAPGNNSFFVAAAVGPSVADGTLLTTTASATYDAQTPSTGSDTTRVARPVVQFTPTSVSSFGNVVVGTTSAAKTVELKNTGSADLTITSIASSGDFAVANTCPAALAPNQTCQLSVTFTPTAVGPRTGTLTVTDNAANSPQTLNLTGTGTQPVLSVNKSDVQLGSVLVNTSKTDTVELRNTGTATLNITSISTPAAPFSLSSCPATLAPNARCTITITFAPTAVGSFSSSFTVTTNGGNATVTLGGTAINPGSSLSATALDFGSQRVGTTSPSQSVTLTNNGSDPLSIASITRSGDASFTLGGNCPIAPTTLAGNSSCTITATFAPTTVGVKNGSITITSNAAASPQTIALVGTGGEAGVALTPATFDFGPVLLGSSAGPQVFTLANTGAAPLTISGLTLSGDFSQTNTCPVGTGTLAGGASCTINITFTPGAAGNRSGQLTVFHDAPGGSASAIVSGLGVVPAPAVTFNPTSLDLGSVDLGTASAPQTITLTNSGTANLTLTSLTTTGDFALAGEDCPDTLAATASCTITITFTPTVGGQRSGVLALASDAPNSPQTVALNGTGLASRFGSNPGVGALNLSSVIGNSNSISIEITNSGATALTISAPTTAVAAPFSIAPSGNLSIAPGSSQSISVTCAPSASGPFSQNLSYTTNDPTQPSVSYAISCTGTAQPSASYASAPAPGSTLDIGAVAGGQSGTTSLSIRETGTAALEVNFQGGTAQTAITGANASSFSVAADVLPLTITDGGSERSLAISCRPRAEGALTATLELATNDPAQPTVRYTLTCTGVGAPVYLAHLPLIVVASVPADLSITSFTVTPDTLAAGEPVRVVAVVTNNGQTAAGPFWVDLYIDPTVVPSTANTPWEETCGTKQPCYGLAWLVDGLAPGASITLTSDAGSYVAANSNWNNTLAAGTRDVYLFVDSWNRDATSGEREANGAVEEASEANNRAEVRGLTITPGAALRDSNHPRSLPQRK